MLYCVVIAHYKENLDWLKQIPSKYIRVYSKGGRELVKPYKITYLPNVGRESHTYLRYIIDSYSELPEIIVFSQGKDDHLPIDKIKQGINILRDFPERKILGTLSKEKVTNLHLTDDFRVKTYNTRTLYPAEVNFCEWFLANIDPTFDFSNEMSVFFGASFAVRREMIQRRPKEFYEKLSKQLEVSDSPEVGHYFERSWFYIFNCHR
jgi:hypothetical protein